MKPDKTYGGKSGVWLTKKRRLSSSTSSKLLNESSLSSSTTSSYSTVAKDCTNSSSLLSGESNHTTNHQTPKKPFYPHAIILKKPRNQVMLLKGSRHVGSIPKKYLIQQRKRKWQQSYCSILKYQTSNKTTTVGNNKKQKHDEQPNTNSGIYSTQFLFSNHANRDGNSSKTTSYGRRISSSAIASPYDSYRYESNQILYSQRITHSPNVKLLGWDSMKCRPIYNCTAVQNEIDVGISNGENYNFDIEEEFLDCDDDDINHNDDDAENDDPNELWRNVLSQMNANSRKNKALHKQKTYGGGAYARLTSGLSNSNTNRRKGLSNMPQSVLERLVSPKRKLQRDKLNLKDCQTKKPKGYYGQTVSKKRKIRRKIKSSPNIDDLRSQVNQRMISSFTTPKKAARKSLNFTANQEEYSMGKENSPNSNSVSSHPGKSIMTPKFKAKITNICLEPSSVDTSLSSALRIPTSHPSHEKIVINKRISSPPSTLQFPDCLDYEEEERKVSFLPRSTVDRKTTKAKLPDRRQKVNTKISKRKAKNNKNQKPDEENHDRNQINQISSSTSLDIAKAFFDRLDRYELKIA